MRAAYITSITLLDASAVREHCGTCGAAGTSGHQETQIARARGQQQPRIPAAHAPHAHKGRELAPSSQRNALRFDPRGALLLHGVLVRERTRGLCRRRLSEGAHEIVPA